MNGEQYSDKIIIDCLIECLEQSLNDNEEYKNEIEEYKKEIQYLKDFIKTYMYIHKSL